MSRDSRIKTLPCVGCSQPTPASDNATRVICAGCVALGIEFPRDQQLELSSAGKPNEAIASQHHHHGH